MYDFTLLIVKDNLLRLSGQNPNLMDVCHWAILFSQRKIWCSLCSERLNGVYPVRCEQSGIQNVFPLLQSMSYKTPSQMLGPLSAHIVVLLQNQKSGGAHCRLENAKDSSLQQVFLRLVTHTVTISNFLLNPVSLCTLPNLIC